MTDHPIPQLLAHLKAAAPLDPAGKEVFLARAPGRLDLMGGSADYSGALACQVTLDCGAAVAVQRREDRKLVLTTYNVDPAHGIGQAGDPAGARVELSLDDLYGSGALLPIDTIHQIFAAERHWATRLAGAFWILAKHRKLTRRVSGANIACYSTVPFGEGVSSSAALEVATFSALTAAYHLILDPLETALMAHLVETQIVGTPAGLTDQATSMLGHAHQLLLLCCQPHVVEGYQLIPPGLLFCGITTGTRHAPEAARQTRTATFMAQAITTRMYEDFGAKKDPNRGYLANIPLDFYHRYLRRNLPARITGRDFIDRYAAIMDRVTTVDAAATYQPRSAADYHIAENQLARAFIEELTAAANPDPAKARPHAESAGQLMFDSHLSHSHHARLGSPEADQLVRAVMTLGPDQGFYGAKITGSGTGRTVAILCADTAAARQRLEQLTEDYRKSTGLPARLVFSSSPGAADTPATKIPVAEALA